MIRGLRDFRLLPLVLLATVSLFALKSLGLMFDGGYIFDPKEFDAAPTVSDEAGDIVGSIGAPVMTAPAVPDTPAVTAPLVAAGPAAPGPVSRPSWAQEMFNYPDITGSVPAKKEAAPPAAAPAGTAVRNESAASPQVRTAARTAADQPAGPGVPERRSVSPSERAILERLQERRKDLEARARKLDMRETLLKAAEKRMEGRVAEIKQTEERIKAGTERTDEAVASRFKGLISMYENMKAKDAARIFDRLDMKVLADVAGHINPRRMSDILANMSPEAAERLTVEFASRNGTPKAPAPADLPKIEGKPNPKP